MKTSLCSFALSSAVLLAALAGCSTPQPGIPPEPETVQFVSAPIREARLHAEDDWQTMLKFVRSTPAKPPIETDPAVIDVQLGDHPFTWSRIIATSRSSETQRPQLKRLIVETVDGLPLPAAKIDSQAMLDSLPGPGKGDFFEWRFIDHPLANGQSQLELVFRYQNDASVSNDVAQPESMNELAGVDLR